MSRDPTATLDDKPTALHEAGHLVARLQHRQQLIGITTIEPNANVGTAGSSSGEEAWGSRQAAEEEIIVSCAGYGALIAAGYGSDVAELGCGLDFEEAEHAIAFWGLGDLEQWKARTVEYMKRPEHLRAVQVISEKLIELRTLDGDHAAVLFDLANGECTAEEYAQYLAFRRASGSDPYL